MDAEHLAQMVDDISNFFVASSAPGMAAQDIAGHIRRAWDPRMRKQIVEVWRAGSVEFSDLGRQAIAILAADPPRTPG